MAEYIGRKISLGVALEETRGTPEASPAFWLRLLAQNHKDKVEYLNSQGSQGTIVETTHAEVDKQWGEGGFDAEIDTESIGLIIYALFGAVDSAAEGDGYLHTFDLEESANHPSLSLWTDEPGRDQVYPLACLSNLSFNFERGKILDFSANFLSQTGESASVTPAFTELSHFRPKDFHFYIANDIAGLDAAQEVFLKTMALEFNKNLEPDDVLGLESPQNFLNKVFSPSATISLLYTDETYRALFKAGTAKAIRIKLENPNNILTAAIPAVAATGSFTIVDYTQLAGKTVTVAGHVLTEGAEEDWSAAGSNNAAATSLASAINALTEVNAVADGADVDITAAVAGTAGNSITLATDGGSDLTKSGNTLANGAAIVPAVNKYLVFDFARVYFAEYDEDNGRDNLKAQEIKLTFGVNSEEADIPFVQARLLNETEEYVATV